MAERPEDELRVLYYQLAEVFSLACGIIAAIRHVGLVAEIHEALACEIRLSVRSHLARGVVEAVELKEALKNREPPYS